MDRYDLEARHAPALLVGLPWAIASAAVVPGIWDSAAITTIFSGASMAALYTIGIRIVRAKGRELEKKLYAAWGGMPTTAMLRHRDTRLNPNTKARFHAGLRGMGSGFRIPTATEESSDHDAADELYASAMDEVRKRAKASGATAVHRENINYGAARNLLAVKQACIVSGLVAIMVILAFLAFNLKGSAWELLTPLQWGCLALTVVYTLAVFLLIWPDMVRHQAEAYAIALFETIP